MTRIERLLGSSRGRALLSLALAAIISLVATAPHVEVAGLRGREVSLVGIYFEQLIIWGSWSLLLWPMMALAGWLTRSTQSWLAFAAVMAPLSLVTSYGALHLGYVVQKPTDAEVVELWEELSQTRENHRGGLPDFLRGEFLPGSEDFDGSVRPGARERERARGGRRPDPRPRERGARPRGRGAGPDWQRNRWRMMRSILQSPDLSMHHWRMRWIQNVLIFWVLLGMGGGLSSFLGMRRKERLAAELELLASDLRVELAGAKLDTLKGQLRPHFLFNALHSVGGLIRAGEEQQALSVLAAIGQLLRSTLDLEQEPEIRLDDELRIARRYLAIEQIRFGDRLQTELSTGEHLGDALIPTLLLLPLVENAVKYGVAPQVQGGQVWVDVQRVDESLVLTIRDDGCGFPEHVLNGEASSAERRSIGLENTRRRLKVLYGDAQLFELRNTEAGGAEVHIELPYHVRREQEPPPTPQSND